MKQFGKLVGIYCAITLLNTPSIIHAAETSKTYTVETVKDINYYTGPDQHKTKHKLDLYLPKGAKNFPVLFFVHGGAWMNGDKDFFGIYRLLATAYVRTGIGVVVINYRLSPTVKHPEHVKDVARAFAWTCKNIARYGGKADALFLCGHSAGAHLIALLTADASWLKEHSLTTKAIRGVIPVSGPYIIPDRFLPQVFGTDVDVRKKASPISHARKDLPPFLCLYAEKDFPGCDRLPCQAFCKALKDKGNQVESLEIKDSDHFRILAGLGANDSLVYKKVIEFIRSRTKN